MGAGKMPDFRVRYTDAGLAKMNACEAAGQSLKLTHIAVGDANGAYYPLENIPLQTELVNEVYRAAINRLYVDLTDPTQIVGEAPILPGAGPFTIREGGAFDVDGTLVFVWLMPITDVPDVADNSDKSINIRFVRKVSNVNNITLITDAQTVMSTQEHADSQGVGWNSGHARYIAISGPVLTSDRIIIVDASSGDIQLNMLPAASPAARLIRIKKTALDQSAHNVILVPMPDDTVEGMIEYTFNGPGEWHDYLPNGVNNWEQF
jgi:phage-related tail fiber protein